MMMRALVPLTYAGRFIAAGEAFELADASCDVDRHVLILTRQAEDVSDARLRDFLPSRRGRYKRRDMRAEE
jgi:hypothetical protein